MKAAIVTKKGGPDVLSIRDVPMPVLSSMQVLIRIRAIGLNFADIMGRLGAYPDMPEPPYIPGMELSGTVEEVGAEVRSFKGGERVLAYSFTGSHAEFVAVREEHVTPLPDSMTFEEGAAFLVTSLTAYHGLVTLANARSGEKLLLHAAAGGVGILSLQLAKHLGMETFATAGTDEKLEVARQHGADHIINYRRDKFDSAVRTMTKEYGVDVVMDSVGGRVFKQGWNLLAPMGRYILYGFADAVSDNAFSILKAARSSLAMPVIFPLSLMSKNRGLLGFNLSTLTERIDYLQRCMGALSSLYNQGVLKPLIGRIFPFAEIRQAHAHLQQRKSIGKVVITLNG